VHHQFAQGDVDVFAFRLPFSVESGQRPVAAATWSSRIGTSSLSGAVDRSRKFGYLAPIRVLSGWSTLASSTLCGAKIEVVPRDRDVHPFGDAPKEGSMVAQHLNGSIIATAGR
jgi:hypothetical protein